MNILITVSSFDLGDFPPEYTAIKNPYGRNLTEDEALELMEKYQPAGIVAGIEPLTRRVMEKGRNLKVISRYGVGLDSIDLEAAKDLGIRVVNTPDAPTEGVTELTLGLMLSLLRHLPALNAGIRGGQWKGPQGNLLQGKTVGIVGCGRIGTRLAGFLTAMGCNLLGYDPGIASHPLCRMVTWEKLVADSDILTLHIPFTKENRHLVNENVLRSMKREALLINAGRGGLVDEEILYRALKEGWIAGAALDCFEAEPYAGPLMELDNILLTPHTGSDTAETRKIMEKQSWDNLMNILTNK